MKNWTIFLFLPLLLVAIIVGSIVLIPVIGVGEDFTITSGTAAQTIAEGTAAAPVTFTIGSVNSFAGTVTLSSLVTPKGVACTLSAPSVTLTAGGTQQVTLSCQGNSADGSPYTATVTGTATIIGTVTTHSASTMFTVTTPSYSVVLSPSTPTGTAGKSTTTATVTVTALNGFTGTVNLLAVGQLSCAFSPASITLGTSGTSTINCGGPNPGQFVQTVNGTSTKGGLVVFHQGQATFSLHGLVCLADPIQTTNTATACPLSTPTFNAPSLSEVSTQTAGGQLQLRVAVNVNASAPLNGFDIILLADHTKLQPFDADLTGSILPANANVLVKCISGVVKAGPVCAPQDTLDTIHLSAAAASFLSPSPQTTGLLFTAVFNIVGDSTTPTPISFQTGCGTAILPTSVPPLCIIIENGGSASVPESAQQVSANEAVGTAATIPWAVVLPATGAATTLSVIAGAGTTASLNIAANVGNGFTCLGLTCIDLSPVTPRVGGNPVAGLTCTVAPGAVAESPTAGTGVSTLSCSTTISTPPGSYTVFVVSASDTSTLPTAGTTYLGSVTSFTLNVGDFKLTTVTQPLYIPIVSGATSSATDQIRVTNLGTFQLTVTVAPTALTGFTLTMNQSSIVLPAGRSHNLTLTAVAAATTGLGSFTATIRGVGLGSLRTTTVNIIVAHPSTVAFACAPSTVVNNTATSCSVTVTDTFAAPTTPGGTASFFTPAGTFAPTTCPLSGTGATATCSVNYTPKMPPPLGTQTIFGFYAGDATHQSGSATTTLTVTAPVTFDFSLSTPAPTALAVTQGSTSPTSSIIATLSAGTTSPVTFTVTSVLPTGVTPIFSNSPCSPTCTIMVSFSATATATLGTVTVTISATGGGVTHTAQLMLTVQAPVAVPTVTVNAPTPNPANTGQTVTVTFTVTSTATVSGITVNWGDGTAADSLTGTATSDTHVYSSTGNMKSQTFTITVTATNSAGPGQGQNTETVNDRPPTVTISTISPNPANTGQMVTVSFTTNDPDGTVSSITINWGDGTAVDSLAGTATSDTHTYANTGSAKSQIFSITITATDNSGSTGSAPTQETVNDRSPVVTITNLSPNPANTGQLVTITFTSSDPDGTVSSITVNWGDTSPIDTLTGSATSDTHTYSGAGSFTITVTATDNSGSTGQATMGVTVNSIGVPVVHVNSPTPNPASTGDTVTVTFTVTSSATVTGITVNWGDGTAVDSLAGTATSDTHVYSSTGSVKSALFTITVTATNSAGPGSGMTPETVNDKAPSVSIVSVSPSPANTGQTVTANLLAGDPDGTIASISVNWGDGSPLDILAGSATSDTHTYASTGTAKSQIFTITATATDNSGSTASVQTQETINDRPPTVAVTNLSPNPANTGQLVTVTFTATDPDGTISSITVNWGDGTPVDNLPGTATSDTHTYNSPGSFTITLTGTDNSGSTGQAMRSITVSMPVGVPTVSITNVTPNPAATGQTVTATFTVSSTATVTGITVNWGDGTAVDSLAGTATSDTHIYTSTGSAKSQTFTLTVTATNSAGQGSATAKEVVNDRPPTVTIANVSPSPTSTGQIVTVTFSTTDPDGTIASVIVDWGDGTTPSSLSGTATSATHTYASTGSVITKQFTITVTATDNSGSAGSATSSATINDRPPVASFTFAPSSPATGQTVNFDASASTDPDGTIVSYAWDFGDGTTGTGVSPTHVFTPATTMTFNVMLTVTDNSGSTASTSHMITVNVVIVTPPTVTITNISPNPANTGQTVTATFTVASTATITGITVSWGDGTTPDSLAGAATSDTHVYASTGNAKTENFTITVTATNSGGSGHASTIETIKDRSPVVTISLVTPNPVGIGKTVTASFTATDPDGTISSITVNWGDGTPVDNLAGTATSDTHSYSITGNFTITITAIDNSGSTGSATATESVTSVAITPVTLTFLAQAPQSPARGPGLLQIFVNDQHVVDVTPGDVNFTTFGPIDITNFVKSGGQNTMTFVNPQTNQFVLVKNVTVTQGNTILLRINRTQKVSAGGTLSFTFSLPAMATKGITVSNNSPFVDQLVTFTAKFTGGTAPFKCIFQFGDDESAVSQGMSGTCTATHDFDSSGTFTTILVIKGASTSDRVEAHLHLNVQQNLNEDDD